MTGTFEEYLRLLAGSGWRGTFHTRALGTFSGRVDTYSGAGDAEDGVAVMYVVGDDGRNRELRADAILSVEVR